MTDESKCPICARRPPADGLVICQPCMGRIDDDLARIVELTRLAAGWISANRAGTANGSARPVPGSRPPLDLAALDAALGNDVLPVLEDWIRLTREMAHLSPYGAATEAQAVTVGSSVQFLRSWLLWASQSPDWPVEDYANEVRSARWQLEALDPDRDKPEGMRVPCPAPHPEADGRTCGYRLNVTMERAADDVCCPRCRETWSGNRLMLVALTDPAVVIWAYPDVITGTIGVPAATLRQWHRRGHLPKRGNRYDAGAAYRRRHASGTGIA
jgi:hypothetical protein